MPERIAIALAAGLVVMVSVPTHAASVKHENPPHGQPGHFHWGANFAMNDWDKALDITLPAASQPQLTGTALCFLFNNPALPRPCKNNFTHNFEYQDPEFGFWYDGLVHSREESGVQTDADWYGYAWGFEVGEVIPADLMGSSGPYTLPWTQDLGDQGLAYTRDHGSGFSNIPEGVPSYLGVRIASLVSGGTWNYGWIGVVRNGGDLEAFEWGYEAVPDTPVPAGSEGAPAIPTISQWGLIVMTILFLGFGMIMARRAQVELA